MVVVVFANVTHRLCAGGLVEWSAIQLDARTIVARRRRRLRLSTPHRQQLRPAANRGTANEDRERSCTHTHTLLPLQLLCISSACACVLRTRSPHACSYAQWFN